MTAGSRLRVAIALGMAALFGVSSAGADSRTDFLVQRLQAEDFRVRTNAALALGATNDDAAVKPLCGALADSSEVVRQASAVALKRLLKPAALGCLKSHLANEKNDAVKLQISRAIEAVEASGGGGGGDSGGGDAPKQIAGAKFYVSFGPVSNQTSRPQADIDRLVIASVRSKLEGLGQYQIAPAKEAPEAARGVMQKRKLKGFFLTTSVKSETSGDGLKVTVSLVIFNYPGKAMQGMLNKIVSQPGVRPGDKSAEDNLISVAAAAAIDSFAASAGNF